MRAPSLVLLALAGSLISGCSQASVGAPPRPSAATSPAVAPTPSLLPPSPDLHVGLLANRPGDLAAATHRDRYDVIVLGQPSDWPAARALKRGNPRLQVFLYKDAMATSVDQVRGSRDLAHLTTGVGYAEARAHHPSWFVRDRNGAPVPFADFPEYRWMDVGNAGYQSAWARSATAEVHRYGADGVMIDDVNAGYGSHLPAGTDLPRYPTAASWGAAQDRFLSAVTRQLHSSGVLALANISQPSAIGSAHRWRHWLHAVDGVLYEYWTKYGTSSAVRPETGASWQRELRRADDVAAAGKLFVPVTYGDRSDAAAQRYARASFLLTWGGGPAAQIWVPSTPADAWLRLDAVTIGTPLGPRRQVEPDVFLRRFSGGVVVVNGSASRTVTVHLHGEYVDNRGNRVSSVVLGPVQAVVLRR